MPYPPNLDDATYPHQARLFNAYWVILAEGVGGQNGVVSGLGVTGSGAMAVNVASGILVHDGTQFSNAGDTILLADADVSNPRFDLVYADEDNAVDVVTGDAAADPVVPDLPAGMVGLASVYIPAQDTAITTAQVIDLRVFVPAPLGASQWTTISAAADRTRSNDATALSSSATNDPDLTFAMAATTKYRIRGVFEFHIMQASALKFGLALPTSPTLVRVNLEYFTVGSTIFNIASNTFTRKPLNAADTSGTTFATGTSPSAWVRVAIAGVVHNGSNSGTFAPRWSQNVATAESAPNILTRLAGSYLEYEVA